MLVITSEHRYAVAQTIVMTFGKAFKKFFSSNFLNIPNCNSGSALLLLLGKFF